MSQITDHQTTRHRHHLAKRNIETMKKNHLRTFAAGLLATVLLLAACAPSTTAGGQGGAAAGEKLTVGLTYTPNIQFAPFYVAAQKGYYKDAGLDVTLRHHGASEDLFGALKTGKEDVINAGGDEMIQARPAVPVVSIATLYHSYPVALLVPADSPIHSAADLRGKTIGAPGPYGETYFGLLALLKNAGLTTKDVDVKYIGFTQQAALTGKKVDGVMGYVNNDAVQFEQAGHPVRALPITQGEQPLPLVGLGIGALDSTLKAKPEAMKKFVAATLKGVAFMAAQPEDAVALSEKYIPGLDAEQARANALATLKATIPLMKDTSGGPGYSDPESWKQMSAFMSEQGLLKQPVPAADAFSNDYLPQRAGS